MKIVNLTPHDVSVYNHRTNKYQRFPSKGVARAIMGTVIINNIEGIRIIQRRPVGVYDLPPPNQGVGYIISRMTAEAAMILDRPTYDLFIPSGLLRDGEGKLIGCNTLAVVEKP